MAYTNQGDDLCSTSMISEILKYFKNLPFRSEGTQYQLFIAWEYSNKCNGNSMLKKIKYSFNRKFHLIEPLLQSCSSE